VGGLGRPKLCGSDSRFGVAKDDSKNRRPVMLRLLE
jgi:hypothetical protein